MKMEKSILDRPLYTIINYIYAFFMTNIYFMLLNGMFIFFFFFTEFQIENILLYYISLLLFGPSMAALLKTMEKLIKEKAIRPTYDFWGFFTKNFKVSMKYWGIQWTIIAILIIDIHYANLYFPFLSIVFLLFVLVSLAVMLYALPILTRFEVKMKNLFVVSFYSVFRFVKTTLLNLSTIVAFGIIYYAMPGFIVLFLMSLLCYFIMYNMQPIFEYLESQFSTTR